MDFFLFGTMSNVHTLARRHRFALSASLFYLLLFDFAIYGLVQEFSCKGKLAGMCRSAYQFFLMISM